MFQPPRLSDVHQRKDPPERGRMNRVPRCQQEHNREKKTQHKQQKYNSQRELPAVCTIREHSQVSLGDFQPLCELLNPMKTSVSKKTNLRLQCEISGLHLVDIYLPRKKSTQLPSGCLSDFQPSLFSYLFNIWPQFLPLHC